MKLLGKLQKALNENGMKLVSEYEWSKARVKIQCEKCGYQWWAFPAVMAKGAPCPDCGGNRRHKSQAWRNYRFQNMVISKHGDFKT